jgi:hypothetical protein
VRTKQVPAGRRRPRAVLLAAALVILVGGVLVARSLASSSTSVVVVLSPHPDDEMQAWGALDTWEADHVVLAYLTRGEATSRCGSDLPGWQEGTGELEPTPHPDGPGTDTCTQARIGSTVDFLERMAPVTDWLPDTLEDAGTVGPLPDPDGRTRRCDGEPAACREGPGDVRVVTGDGVTVLFFDLGDGDLEPGEVGWAASTVTSSAFDAWLPADRHVTEVVGAGYFNEAHDRGGAVACAEYPHADHGALTAVLRDVDLGLGERQWRPTCRTDTATSLVAPVDEPAWTAAFEVDGERRVGHHPVVYGWLLTPYFAGDGTTCPAAEATCADAQQQLFHRHQTFATGP